ncbi:MAG: transposase [Oscillospiraceae bacterium]
MGIKHYDKQFKGRHDRLAKIYADGGYRGKLIDTVKDTVNCEMEITLRTDKSTAFKPLPKRWVVERSFAWLDDFRRLSKDYERKVVCSENMGRPCVCVADAENGYE